MADPAPVFTFEIDYQAEPVTIDELAEVLAAVLVLVGVDGEVES